MKYDVSENIRAYENGKLDDAGTLTNNRASPLFNQGTLNNSGTLKNYSGGTYEEMINFGTLTNNLGGTLNNNGSLDNNGDLDNWGHLNNYSHLNTSGTLNNNDHLNTSGTLTNIGTLNNYWSLTNNGDLGNHHTLLNQTGGTLTNIGTLTNHIGARLTHNGTIDTTSGSFINDGLLIGEGHITGHVSGSGTIAPGNSSGVLTIDGHLTHYDGGHQIELGGHFHGGGDNSLTEFDWLDVTGDVELAGTLEVYLIDSFELLAGMSFDILKVGGTLTGQYGGLDEGLKVGSFSGTNLYITYAGGNGNDVTLFSRAVPEPAALLLALLGLALLPRRRGR